MRRDHTCNTIFGHAFIVQDLMRWLVADLRGAREPIDALHFSRPLRVPAPRAQAGIRALRVVVLPRRREPDMQPVS